MRRQGNQILTQHWSKQQHDLLAYFPLYFPLRLYYSTLHNSIVSKSQNYSLYCILMLLSISLKFFIICMHNISPNNNIAYFHTSHYVCITQPSKIFHSFKISKLLVILHLDVCINLIEFLYHTYVDVLFLNVNGI